MPFFVDHLFRDQPLLTRVEGEALRIGRGTNAELRLEEPTVDLEHARIEGDAAGYRLLDQGSTTGTYLNGKPAGGTYLKDGDTIEIGATRIAVAWEGPGTPLRLEVRTIAAAQDEAMGGDTREAAGAAPAGAEGAAASPAGAAGAGRPPIAVEEVDYLRAYRLRRPFFTKGALAVLLTAAAIAAIAALPILGAYRAFQPGNVSKPHQREMDAKFAVSCAGCHRPWSGPVEQQCLTCHPRAGHQARQAVDPPCAGCHFEHRGADSLTRVSDASCVACHGDLKVKGAEPPAYAARITAFPAGHADFSVTLPSGPRLPLAEAVSRRADPGTLRFGHFQHLRGPLRRTGGAKVRLRCEDCHRVERSGPTGLAPVRYEEACAACHPLSFDSNRPDSEAPHVAPRQVRAFLAELYSDRRDPNLSLREIRNRIVRGTGPQAQIDVSARATRRVLEAERYLYTSACKECHEVDADAVPLPTVTSTAAPQVWLPHSHFPHAAHTQGIACTDCHANAAASKATADVLLPGLAACGGCHGGGGPPPGKATLRSGPTQCRSCHGYHPKAQPAATTLAGR